MSDEPYTAEIDVRFRDLDPMGHVNNAVYATYLEQARANYYDDVLDASLPEVDTVIVQLEISYREAIEIGDDVEVTLDVPELGESSIPMEYEILTNGAVAATGETVQVMWDREAGTSRPLPAWIRTAIEDYHDL